MDMIRTISHRDYVMARRARIEEESARRRRFWRRLETGLEFMMIGMTMIPMAFLAAALAWGLAKWWLGL